MLSLKTEILLARQWADNWSLYQFRSWHRSRFEPSGLMAADDHKSNSFPFLSILNRAPLILGSEFFFRYFSMPRHNRIQPSGRKVGGRETREKISPNIFRWFFFEFFCESSRRKINEVFLNSFQSVIRKNWVVVVVIVRLPLLRLWVIHYREIFPEKYIEIMNGLICQIFR